MTEDKRLGVSNVVSNESDTLERTRVKKPSFYKVLLINDDYTPMEFVTWLLSKVFHKTNDDAQRIMLMVHRQGLGICGIYSYEVASTRVRMVSELARRHHHPLLCRLEKD